MQLNCLRIRNDVYDIKSFRYIPSLSSIFTWAEDGPPIVIGGSVISTITVKLWSPSRALSSMIVIYAQDKLPLEVT